MKQNKPLKAKTPLKAKKPIKPNGAVRKTAKPHTISWYKKKADIAHSTATRLRFAEVQDGTPYKDWLVECITCGVKKPVREMQCGHFMSRQYNATRYDEQNTSPQCYGCNVMHQGRQYEFGLALDALYGKDTAKAMHDKAKQPHKLTINELKDIIEEAKEEIRFYEERAKGNYKPSR